MTGRRACLGMAAGLSLLLLAGCFGNRQRVVTEEKRALMQTRDVAANVDTAFAAMLSVLQDAAWLLDVMDKEHGIIRATTQKEQSLVGPRDDWRKPGDRLVKRLRKEAKRAAKRRIPYPHWTRWHALTVRLEPYGTDAVRVRLALVKHGTLPSGAKAKKRYAKKTSPIVGQEQSLMVDDPKVYKALFDKLEAAILARQEAAGT